ncbi:NAD(P)/FAD-dependent oxidoreductase [Paenibacillus sp. URB8-2]|uniref:NAD(P)/FAD-dependent oxidoreductase n=1 Tax=Paenibacillus sp. URB8-2 TaxID=2741301 RepID=UPI0015BEAD49|nr:NAD(P)/FAD-dependent oxidoreductase [Paenibacillus sp. URB8-2]BCG61612.1 FAD-dependent dehydrogenase [Paenibacillus sp. URB8-2]
MKIAIMGAGLSGLACALTLEKHGIQPSIFEKRSMAGDRFVNGEVLLSIMTRPVHDSIASLSDQFGIFLQPTANIRTMNVYSKNKAAVLEGELGYSNVRGRNDRSFEAQLARQLKSPIHFHSMKTYEDLLQDYTHVVVATGDASYAKQSRNFREDLTVSIKGATVEGNFDLYTVMTWMDYDLGPYGYGYLIPFSEKEANIVVAIPDIPKNKNTSTDQLWEPFYTKVQSLLGQDLPITDQFQITQYPIGICQSARLGNTFYVGNCFGSMMPFMGFGQYTSLLTGVYAAYDLCGQGSYEELTQPLRQSYENSLVLRRAMEQLKNNDLDRIIHLLGGYWGKKLSQTKHIDLLKIAGYLLRPYLKITSCKPPKN